MKALRSPLSSRAYPDFLFAALKRAACAVFCKENRMELAAPPTWTGNPGKPRDLQFRGSLLEMFFDRVVMALRPTQGDEKLLKGTAFQPLRHY